MASSSSSSASMNRMCSYCKTVSATLWPGWRLRNGSSALLCNHCVSAYEEGIFCYIFHWDASGWRDCVTCKRMVHCGCIMSTHTHTELDFGGVRCTECISNDMLMGANSCRSKFKNACPMTLRDLPEVRLSVDLGKVITGITGGTPSQEDAPSCENREQLYTDSPDVVNEQHQSDSPRKIHSYRKYLPEASDEDLEQIQKHSNSSVIPLFEKELTSSDADPKNGRLVIPKKCAQDYLPKISEPQGVPIKIQDTGGKYWNFRYRFWPNNNSTMYVLEGTRDYLAANQCQPGDKVTFYRIEPEGQLVLGLKKAQASTSELEDPVIGGSLLSTYTTGYAAPLLLAASFARALQSLLLFGKFSSWMINPLSGALLLGGGVYSFLDRLFPPTIAM